MSLCPLTDKSPLVQRASLTFTDLLLGGLTNVMCLHYVLAFLFSFFLTYIFIADNITMSLYIMCVILCLFSALSRRVGSLQISIIVIINR